VQAIAQQPLRAPDGAALHYERHRPEQTTHCRLVQHLVASFIAHTEASSGAELPRFIKDEFDALLECGILASGGYAAGNAVMTSCGAGLGSVSGPVSGLSGPIKGRSSFSYRQTRPEYAVGHLKRWPSPSATPG